MKKQFIFFAVCIYMTLILSSILLAQDPIIHIEPVQTTIGVGEVCSIDIIVENAINLGALQFDIVYNSAIVHANSATLGTFLSSTGRTAIPAGTVIDNESAQGKVTYGAATIGANAGPNGTGVLATIEFEAQAVGNTILELQNLQISDITGIVAILGSVTNGEIIVATPQLKVDPITLDFGLTEVNKTFDISNVSIGTLEWTIAENPAIDWVTSITPASGSNNATVTVTVDRTQMTGENASGTLTVTSNGGNQDITVLIAREEHVLPDHWNFTENTGSNATIVLPISANPNIDDEPLVEGDHVGVFTLCGLCCGWGIWDGTNLKITAWGNDTQTSEIDGFQENELIYYRTYRMSEQQEWKVVICDYSTGDGIYLKNAYHVLNQFDASNKRCMSLEFHQGWNMFSINVEPENPDIINLMAPIVDNLTLIKNGHGLTYIPQYEINDLINLNFKEGYQVYLSESSILEICGLILDPMPTISLPIGWNMLSYLPNIPIDANEALTSIIDQLVLAKDGNGNTYVPQSGINDIGEMQPGQGYQLYLNDDATLEYPVVCNTTQIVAALIPKNKAEHFQPIFNTGGNAILIIHTDAELKYNDGNNLKFGDEIGIFNNNGICCGAKAWEGKNIAITIWGDDSQTENIDGLTSGAEINFKIWRKSVDTEYLADANYQAGDPTVYQTDGISTITKLNGHTISEVSTNNNSLLPENFKLSQNYPNPFNPKTTITYDLPYKSTVELTIIDMQGHSVKQLIASKKPAGNYSIMWDGRNNNGQLVTTGMYIYQIKITPEDNTQQSYINSKKMIMIK